ncbi:hypothetical protein CRG98_030194 [Punica granatum]|uniref:Uncharacterized protein n=1 Tax=Punica granatum TaxID=22663 RepID=A0A2I0IZM5_PUNGR|nr:hypothetical protein CRG98_030194 [Punica granatum]
MEPAEYPTANLDGSLSEFFSSQMSMSKTQDALKLKTNAEELPESIHLTLLIKPFGFKPPPPKAVIPRLLQAWIIKKGVTVSPKRYSKDILVCLFKDKRDMTYVEKDRAWSVQGAHMMLACWDKGLALEEVTFDSVTFWIQIIGIPPELLSKRNITKLAARAGEVLEIDWKDTPSLPKWYVTPRALVSWSLSRSPYAPVSTERTELQPGPTSSMSTSELSSTIAAYWGTIKLTAHLNPLHPQIYMENSKAPLPDDCDNDNSMQSQTASGRFAAQKLLTVGVQKGKEADCADSSFLRRGNFDPRRRAPTEAYAVPISTDTLYSGLIDDQAQAEAQFLLTARNAHYAAQYLRPVRSPNETHQQYHPQPEQGRSPFPYQGPAKATAQETPSATSISITPFPGKKKEE